MKILFFPGEAEQQISPTEKFLKKVARKYPDSFSQFEVAINKLEKEGFEYFKVLQETEHVKNLGDGMWEFRFPKQSKKPVLRAYFCFAKKDQDTIVIVDAEVKNQKKADLSTARNNMKAFREKE